MGSLRGGRGATNERRSSGAPRALFEGRAAERLARDGGPLVSELLAGDALAVWRALWIARPNRSLWISDEAPLLDPVHEAQPADVLVSTVLADVARAFRADASNDEILVRYGKKADEDGSLRESLTEKLIALERWEGEQYASAI